MKNFWQKFRLSLSDHRFYKDLASGAEPLKLRYGLALLGAIVLVAVGTVVFYREALPTFRQGASELVPSDLVAELKSGELSINRPMPFVIPMPADEAATDARANLLVIDLDAPSTLDVAGRYDTALFANRTMLVTEKENGKIEAIPFKDFPNFTFTRDVALGWVAFAAKYAWAVAIAALILLSLFSFLGLLIGSLIAGAIVWIVLKIAKRPTTYRGSFAVALHAYTFPVVLNIALGLFSAITVSGIFGVLAVAAIASALTLIGQNQTAA